MSEVVRDRRMNLRMSQEEERIRDVLAKHLGVEPSGVMRMGMLELARKEGISIPVITSAKKKP